MDWHKEIAEFKYLHAESLGMFAPPGEMHQAIATYNKAIDRLKMDSADIALIALKKLAATYPTFAQASFLLACCQMVEGHIEDAVEHFEHASLLDLPDSEHNRAHNCLLAAREELAALRIEAESEQKVKTNERILLRSRSRSEDNDNQNVLPTQLGGAAILHKSRRGSRVRMASDKEKREVIRKSDFPEEKQTHVVYNKNLFDYLRKALPIIAIMVLAGAVVLGSVYLIGQIKNRSKDRTPDEKQRLEWLEEKLAGLAAEDDKAASILQQYNEFVDSDNSVKPDGESAKPSETETAASTTETSAVPETSATTLPTTVSPEEIAKAKLEEQYGVLEQVRMIQKAEPVAAAEKLLLLQEILKSIPAETSIEVEDAEAGEGENITASVSAAEILTEADSLMQSVGQKAAEELRVKASSLFNQEDYEAALADYEKAFKFYPLAYGGGVAYYCGRSHQELGQYDQARPYFEFVIENFAGRELAGYAANRLDMMGF